MTCYTMQVNKPAPMFRINLLPLSPHCKYEDAVSPKRQREFTHKTVNLVVIATTTSDIKRVIIG